MLHSTARFKVLSWTWIHWHARGYAFAKVSISGYVLHVEGKFRSITHHAESLEFKQQFANHIYQ